MFSGFDELLKKYRAAFSLAEIEEYWLEATVFSASARAFAMPFCGIRVQTIRRSFFTEGRLLDD